MSTLSRKVTLRGARISAGFSTKNMSKIMGVTERTIWNWETGKTRMRVDQLSKYCSVCGFNTSDVDFLRPESIQSYTSEQIGG